MLVSVLASGSKGNCTYIETKDAKILIDLGMNLKYITNKLNELNVNIEEITHVIFTHTHDDHISSLKSFIKIYKPVVLLSEKMYDDLEILHNYDNLDFSYPSYIYKSTRISMIHTSHDSSDSRGYIINDGNLSLVYLTDTGYLNQKYFEDLYNKNIYIIESNHDVEMLINGKYPKWLKSRILSDKGHLSNNAAGFYLSKFIGVNTKKVILAHLSHENNTCEKAVNTIMKTLKEYEVDFNDIIVATQDEKTEVVNI